MTASRHDSRSRVLIALLAVAVLTVAGAAVLRVVGNEYRRNLADHMLSNLETLERVLGLLQQDSADRVRLIAAEPEQRRLSLALLARPHGRAWREQYRAWITPFYRSRGFEDYALISPDGERIVAAGEEALVGRQTLPATRDALRLAELMGSATTRRSRSASDACSLPVNASRSAASPGLAFQRAHRPSRRPRSRVSAPSMSRRARCSASVLAGLMFDWSDTMVPTTC